MRRGYRPKNSLIHGPRGRRLAQRAGEQPAQFVPGLLAYRFSHSMYYANAQQFSEQVLELVNGADPKLEWFCLDAVAIDDVDYSAAAKLRSTYSILKDKGIRLVFAVVSDDVKAELDRFGITDLVGKDAFYATGDELLSAYHQRNQQ